MATIPDVKETENGLYITCTSKNVKYGQAYNHKDKQKALWDFARMVYALEQGKDFDVMKGNY